MSSFEEKPLIHGTHLQQSVEPVLDLPKRQEGSNVIATFFNFAKASIGSGSFALPFAVLSAGVLLGSAGMIILGIVSVYTMQLMLECKQKAVEGLSPEQQKEYTYTELGRAALGVFGKWAVDFSVLGCNLGVCAGYMIFIASNLRWAFTCFAYHHESHTGICFTTYEVYAFIIPILILLTYLPSFKYLAYAAYVGAIFLVVAMITVFVYGIQNGFMHDTVQWLPSSWLNVAQWFGLTAFLFCIHSMVIPLESAMKHPQYMTYILDAAALVVVGINLPFALYGYFLFGSETQGYIFENMPGGAFNDTVRIFLSLELTLTFPIVFKPASDVMEEIIQNFLLRIARYFDVNAILELYGRRELKWKIAHTVMICSMRTILVLISWGVAVGIPRFELCLAFVGSLATSILAFVLPPLFHLSLKWHDTAMYRNILHIVILVVGIIATALATGINLYEAIANGGSSDNCHSVQESCVKNTTDTSDFY